MELTDQELELLEAFYFGTLPSTDRTQLAKRMAEDDEFAREAHTFLEGLHFAETGKVKTHSAYLIKNSPALPPSVNYKKWFTITAALLLAGAGLWYILKSTPTESIQPENPVKSDPEEKSEPMAHNSDHTAPLTSPVPYQQKDTSTAAVFNISTTAYAFYEPYPRLNDLMGDVQSVGIDTATNPALRDSLQLIALQSEAMEAYNEKEYAAAVVLMDRCLRIKPRKSLQFYKAVALLGDRKPQKAIPVFLKLYKDDSFIQSAAVPWYLALAYAVNNQPDMALPILDKIINEQQPYYSKKAVELKTKLTKTGSSN